MGILAASLLAFPLATAEGWRAMMALTPALCGAQLLLAPFLHESPRWLLERNPHSAAAALSLRQLYGLRSDLEVPRNPPFPPGMARGRSPSHASAHWRG